MISSNVEWQRWVVGTNGRTCQVWRKPKEIYINYLRRRAANHFRRCWKGNRHPLIFGPLDSWHRGYTYLWICEVSLPFRCSLLRMTLRMVHFPELHLKPFLSVLTEEFYQCYRTRRDGPVSWASTLGEAPEHSCGFQPWLGGRCSPANCRNGDPWWALLPGCSRGGSSLGSLKPKMCMEVFLLRKARWV